MAVLNPRFSDGGRIERVFVGCTGLQDNRFLVRQGKTAETTCRTSFHGLTRHDGEWVLLLDGGGNVGDGPSGICEADEKKRCNPDESGFDPFCFDGADPIAKTIRCACAGEGDCVPASMPAFTGNMFLSPP